MNTYQSQAAVWLNNPLLPDVMKDALRQIMDDPQALADSFSRPLAFGTGGLRGKLGAGDGCMNPLTVARATEGLADYLLSRSALPSCAIAYDSRHFSETFAKITAAVLAARGVRVHLYPWLSPTPSLSFAVRYLRCDGGVVITASHNPSEYNGYKVYGPDGAQAALDMAQDIAGYIEKQPLLRDSLPDYDALLNDGFIRLIDKEVDDAYLQAVMDQSVLLPTTPLKVAYSPLFGAGNRPVRKVLGRLPLVEVAVVTSQENPDGDFPGLIKPNPEYPDTMEAVSALAYETGADICLATDPDCDRVGVALPLPEGLTLLSGNQIGVLLLDFICQARELSDRMPDRPIAITTIVSTPMAEALAAHHGVELKRVLTGFKFIGEEILRLQRAGEESRFIFGFEESYGYLSGSFVRDKDAVNASLLICEMAACYKAQGMTLLDAFHQLEQQHGYYASALVSGVFEGASGMAAMGRIMTMLRETTAIGGYAITERIDYLNDDTGLPASDVLSFKLGDSLWLMARPSGTEPMLKLYINARGDNAAQADEAAKALAAAADRWLEGARASL